MLKELRITIPELPCVKVKTISPELFDNAVPSKGVSLLF